jgi:polyisoprenoid-binding protein YceI
METQTSPITGTFVADQAHSSVLFSVQHMKVSRFRASFSGIEARLSGAADGLTLDGTVDVSSISIGDPPDFRTHVVDGVDFFDVGVFPEIGFRSTRFDVAEDGSVSVEGDLTIKEVTRAVSARGTLRGPVADILGGHSASLDLTTTLDRRDFGLAWQMALPDGDDVLGWDIEVAVQLELHQAS